MNRSPQALDQRSLDLHKLIATKIGSNDVHLQLARANIARWRQRDPKGCQGWDEWELLLQQGLQSTLAAMLDAGEQGQYLRSCTPFTRVLSARERAEFFKRWSANS